MSTEEETNNAIKGAKDDNALKEAFEEKNNHYKQELAKLEKETILTRKQEEEAKRLHGGYKSALKELIDSNEKGDSVKKAAQDELEKLEIKAKEIFKTPKEKQDIAQSKINSLKDVEGNLTKEQQGDLAKSLQVYREASIDKLNDGKENDKTLKAVEDREKEALEYYRNLKKMAESIKDASQAEAVHKEIDNFRKDTHEARVFKTEEEKRNLGKEAYKGKKAEYEKALNKDKELKNDYKSKKAFSHTDESKEAEQKAKMEYLNDRSVINALSAAQKEKIKGYDALVDGAKNRAEMLKDKLDKEFKDAGVPNIKKGKKSIDNAIKDKDKELKKAKKELKDNENLKKESEKELLKILNKGLDKDKQITLADLNNSDQRKVKNRIAELPKNKAAVQGAMADLEKYTKKSEASKQKVEAAQTAKDKVVALKVKVKEDLAEYKQANKDYAVAVRKRGEAIDGAIKDYQKQAKVIVEKEYKKIKKLEKGTLRKTGLKTLNERKKETDRKLESLENKEDMISRFRKRRLRVDRDKLTQKVERREEEKRAREDKIAAVKEGREELLGVKEQREEAVKKETTENKDLGERVAKDQASIVNGMKRTLSSVVEHSSGGPRGPGVTPPRGHGGGHGGPGLGSLLGF